MRRLIAIAVVTLVAATAVVETQTSLTGRWRAVLLTPDGSSQPITLDLVSSGTPVTGTVQGLTIGEGRLEGETLTLKLTAPNKREVSLTGQVSGDEIVFASTGLPPGPVRFVARRNTPPAERVPEVVH